MKEHQKKGLIFAPAYAKIALSTRAISIISPAQHMCRSISKNIPKMGAPDLTDKIQELTRGKRPGVVAHAALTMLWLHWNNICLSLDPLMSTKKIKKGARTFEKWIGKRPHFEDEIFVNTFRIFEKKCNFYNTSFDVEKSLQAHFNKPQKK